eukprot:COSAG02_NODE_203_length_29261_cov_20.960395_7_plen_864_part_00
MLLRARVANDSVCHHGTFVVEIMVWGCGECLAGKYSSSAVPYLAQGACIDCAAGKYSDTTGAEDPSVCRDCAAGKYSTTTGRTSQCTSSCTSCPAGRSVATACTRSANTGACSDCAAGRFRASTTTTATSCTACYAGQYQANQGQSSCSDCDDGSFTTNDANDLDGTGVSTAATYCNACPQGQFNTQGDSTCEYLQCLAPAALPVGHDLDGGTTVAWTADGFALPMGTTASCATSYQNAAGVAGGPATVTACMTNGQPYGLSGCEEIVCTYPATTTGYEITATQLSLAQTFDVTVTCAEHYYAENAVSVQPCTESGPFTISGCAVDNPCAVDEDDCTGDQHECYHTGQGTHECSCPNDRHGTATGDADGSVQPGCTLCSAQTGCATPRVAECSGVVGLTTQFVCEPTGNEAGYFVDGDGTVNACASGTWQPAGEQSTTACPACTPQEGCAESSTECIAVALSAEPAAQGKLEQLVCLTADSGWNVDANGIILGSIVCTRPAIPDGFDTPTETNLDLSQGFDVSVTCANGYEGTVAATACTTSGEYTLTGSCTAIICTTPAAIPAGVDEYNLVLGEGNLDLSMRDFDVSVTCANGYEGTIAATACTTSGEYTLTGSCTAIICTAPSPIPSAYDTADLTNLDLSQGVFSASVSCAEGFSGTGMASCTTSGDYDLTGCSSECQLMVGEYQICMGSTGTTCEFTVSSYGETELAASVSVSATGTAGFASATASASASATSTSGSSDSSTVSVNAGECKYSILLITRDYSNAGCRGSKTVSPMPPVLLSPNLVGSLNQCEPNTMFQSGFLPDCSDSQISEFISEDGCDIKPPPATTPTPAGPAPATSTASMGAVTLVASTVAAVVALY